MDMNYEHFEGVGTTFHEKTVTIFPYITHNQEGIIRRIQSLIVNQYIVKSKIF